MNVYPDSCVFIASLIGTHWAHPAAVRELRSAGKSVVISPLVVLETESSLLKFPGITMAERRKLVSIAASVFEAVPAAIEITPSHFSAARQLVGAIPALSVADAVHAACALDCGALFLTAEKPSKPLAMIPGLNFKSIYGSV